MAGRGEEGMIAPQPYPSQTHSFGNIDRREQPKNFVFIDEQNRHKRLKVVKACDGCRKRKIKCDAANNNAWPCGACIRLKMTCVPPAPEAADTFNYEIDQTTSYSFPPHASTWEYPTTPNEPYPHRQSFGSFGAPPPMFHRVESHDMPVAGYTNNPLMQSQSPTSFPKRSGSGTEYIPDGESFYKEGIPKKRQDSSLSVKSESSDQDLLDQMGDLKVSLSGLAPWLVNNKALAEQPALQEEDVELPQSQGPGSHVHIPEEMMPPYSVAIQYFNYFFDNFHPYVAVLYPPYLYRHWEENRNSISPLILEAIFACSTRMMGAQAESTRWLTLAKKHEESFRDTPRLSTLQGLLLLLKAREATPTRGYYYRSWMSIVNMVAMAKDLGLHEHFEQHQNGGTCDASIYDCLVKSRVWHVLYAVELIVGGPQGRSDFGVATDTVDFNCTYPQLDPGDPENLISQQFAHLMRAIRNVRESIALMTSFKKQKKEHWALESKFVMHNASFDQWIGDLPQHLRINYPLDGSAPHIPFHFVANLHSYWNLSIIMHRRPQLQLTDDALSENWKTTMVVCYSAAKRLCRLQESIMNQFGLPGMVYMQRGVNFTIYAVLTCTMLHLVAITHPDPEIYFEAANYFTRHMKILELCSNSWPMPELKQQILSLRQAFSADINKPFELKSDFPGSPMKSGSSSSEAGSSATLTEVTGGDATHTPTTPTRSALSSSYPVDINYPTPDSLEMVGPLDHGQYQAHSAPVGYVDENLHWNPNPIIHNFESMMGIPSSDHSTSSVSPTQPSMSTNSYLSQGGSQQLDSRYAAYSQPPPSMPQYSPHDGSMPPIPVSVPQAQSSFHQQPPSQSQPGYITPSMWHSAVVSALGPGTKRRWNDVSSYPDAKRAR